MIDHNLMAAMRSYVEAASRLTEWEQLQQQRARRKAKRRARRGKG